jgi:hypothetical protein
MYHTLRYPTLDAALAMYHAIRAEGVRCAIDHKTKTVIFAA